MRRSAIVVVAALVAGALTMVVPAGRAQTPVRAPERVWREVPLVVKFDLNKDTRLDVPERQVAREYLAAHPELRPAGRGSRMGPGSPGPSITPEDVAPVPSTVPLYDNQTLRTLFLDFDNPGWEREMAAFWFTDVDVPARLTVDRVASAGTGVHMRGHNSFLAVPEGRKRSLTVSPDFSRSDQRLLGYRGLHLLNAYPDPTFVRGVLFLEIARKYIPAPRANFVRVVINGESWGVYVNQQRFDTDFLRDHFKTTSGTRWRSLNNAPGGGLSYLGDDPAPYREAYEIKSKDVPAAWEALIRFCKALHETPPERLASALEPMLDVDGALKFLALDNALMNGDGYWEDGSDFSLYLDPSGRFHFIQYDVNEAFRPVGGARAGGPGRGVEIDPFAMAVDPNKALLGKLLAAPDLRARYLGYVREIAEQWLDWKVLDPIVRQRQALIANDIARDTRKLYSTAEFTAGVYGDGIVTPAPLTTLKGFVEARQAFLLSHHDVKTARRPK
jgi:hypothetical protein